MSLFLSIWHENMVLESIFSCNLIVKKMPSLPKQEQLRPLFVLSSSSQEQQNKNAQLVLFSFYAVSSSNLLKQDIFSPFELQWIA